MDSLYFTHAQTIANFVRVWYMFVCVSSEIAPWVRGVEFHDAAGGNIHFFHPDFQQLFTCRLFVSVGFVAVEFFI